MAFEALDQALNNPLVSIANIDTAKGIIFQLFCKSEPKLSTYNGLIEHIREKITNKSVLIVPGVTLEPNLSSEIEILIVASGIVSFSSEECAIDGSTTTDDDFFYEELKLSKNIEQSYTDIPAITRKLRAHKRTEENNV